MSTNIQEQSQHSEAVSMPQENQNVAVDADNKNLTIDAEKSHGKGIDTFVIGAIRHLKDQNGSSLPDIKKVLKSKHQLDTKKSQALNDIKKFLKDAIDKGTLTKQDGKYKIAGRAKRKSDSKKSGGKPSKKRSVKRSTNAKGVKKAKKLRSAGIKRSSKK